MIIGKNSLNKIPRINSKNQKATEFPKLAIQLNSRPTAHRLLIHWIKKASHKKCMDNMYRVRLKSWGSPEPLVADHSNVWHCSPLLISPSPTVHYWLWLYWCRMPILSRHNNYGFLPASKINSHIYDCTYQQARLPLNCQ